MTMAGKKTLFQEFLDRLEDIGRRYVDNDVPMSEIESLIDHVRVTEESFALYCDKVFRELEEIGLTGAIGDDKIDSIHDVVVPTGFDRNNKEVFDKAWVMDILSTKFQPKVQETMGLPHYREQWSW